jgi:hypothetical protein
VKNEGSYYLLGLGTRTVVQYFDHKKNPGWNLAFPYEYMPENAGITVKESAGHYPQSFAYYTDDEGNLNILSGFTRKGTKVNGKKVEVVIYLITIENGKSHSKIITTFTEDEPHILETRRGDDRTYLFMGRVAKKNESADDPYKPNYYIGRFTY